MIKENLVRVRDRIAAAAQTSGRNPQEVLLIVVTKEVSVDRIREALACGVREIGENRIQEAGEKRAALGSDLRWHLIGHLQRNKAKFAVEMFDVVHSVDSLELVELLDRQAALRRTVQGEREVPSPYPSPQGGEGSQRKLEVLIQVNVSGEETKFGCRSEQTEKLTEAVLNAKYLKWTGLMTMAPFSDNAEDSRPFFRKLRELRDNLQERFSQSQLHLSMGMSQDFEVAVQEGATMVRVGSAIFGER